MYLKQVFLLNGYTEQLIDKLAAKARHGQRPAQGVDLHDMPKKIPPEVHPPRHQEEGLGVRLLRACHGLRTLPRPPD